MPPVPHMRMCTAVHKVCEVKEYSTSLNSNDAKLIALKQYCAVSRNEKKC